QVDPLVSTLRREDGGGQQLKGIAVIQLAVCGGVLGFELSQDAAGAFAPRRHAFAWHQCRRARAKARKSAALRVLRIASGPSAPLREIPTPNSMMARPERYSVA